MCFPCWPRMGTDRADQDQPYLQRLVMLARDTLREAPQWYPRAALEVADAVGCVLRGADHPMVRRAAAGVMPSEPYRGPFPCLADRSWLSLDQAVLVDSLACHVDEFDSIHPASATVPAAVVVPTALVLSGWLGASGPRLLDAVQCGYDVLTSVAARFGGPSLYRRSWWPTSSFGALGAAAAAGVLLDLDDEALANAFGIAASGVGGLLSSDRLGEGHYLGAAQAAVWGVQAAFRARAGMEASATLLDGPASRAFDGLGDPSAAPVGGAVQACVTKWFPCARPLHGMVEGLLQLRGTGLDLRSLTAVQVALHPDALRFVTAETSVPGPTEAAASAMFVLSATAQGRESDPSLFREAKLAWEGPLPRVWLAPTPPGPFTWDCLLSGTTASGATFDVVGKASDSADVDRLRVKFLANVAVGGLESARAGDLFKALSELPTATDTAALLRSLVDRSG